MIETVVNPDLQKDPDMQNGLEDRGDLTMDDE